MEGKNVLQIVDQIEPNLPPVPVYDLSGDRMCIAIFIQRQGPTLSFFSHLKLPAQERMFQFMRDREIYAVPTTDKERGRDMQVAAIDVDKKFFNELNLGVEYKEPDRYSMLKPDEFDQLDLINNVRIQTVGLGIMRVGNPGKSEEEAPTLAELLNDSPTVQQFVLLAADNHEEYRLSLTHRFSIPTAKQSADYQRTQKLRTVEGGAQKFVNDYKMVAKLYDALIQKVDNVIGTTDQIRQVLPFVYKMNAISQLFRNAEIKNV